MKGIKQTYLCLSAQSYRIVDEATGRVNEGVSVWYIPDDTLEPEEDPQATNRGQLSRGKKVAKMSLPLHACENMDVFPGLYDVELEMVTVAQKQMVRPKTLTFVAAVKLVADRPKANAS